MRKLLSAIVLGFIGALAISPLAHAVTPTYEVTEDGLQLIAGETFQDSYHVNLKLVGDSQQRNMHIEAKCLTKTDHECAAVRHSHVGLTLHEEAQFIGKNYLPWSTLGIKPGQCIEWLQVYNHAYHYGENGEPPVCLSDKPDIPLTPEKPDIPNPTPPERVETATSGLQEVELHLTAVVLIWLLIIFGIAAALGVVISVVSHGDSAVGIFLAVFGSTLFITVAIASLVSGYPYDFKYYQIYETQGVVESVSNTFSGGDGRITGRPVVEFSSLDRPITVSDPRIINLVGKELELSCTLEWVYQSEDRIHCTIRKVL